MISKCMKKVETKQCDIHNVTCCIATEHAYDRAKERLNWKSKVLDKMMQKAYEEGIQHKDTKGSLKRSFMDVRQTGKETEV